MNFSWEDEGVKHSQAMLQTELTYLNEDFKQSMLVSSPVVFAQDVKRFIHKWVYKKTGIETLAAKVVNTENPHWVLALIAKYAIAAMNITQVFAVRLAILMLAMPAFIIGAVAVIEGLTQRDIRRWSVGRERATMYHYSKRAVPFFLIAPWFVYLAMPNSIHPNLVILPFVVFFAIGLYFMTYLFKKHI